jgi:bifunctional DNA-binding transcriptional regulator/antitoxin component of YhaV-PrlF toxin-antitoxin module
VFDGRVDADGVRLTLADPSGLRRRIRALAGQRVEVVVRPRRRKRSDRANRYYWGVVLALFADAIGDERDELHESLKLKLLGLENPDGQLLPRVRSTAKLTPREFDHYVEDVKRLAVRMFPELVIPDPQ